MIQGKAAVSGTVTERASARTLPAPFDEATARGLADRIIEGNATFDTPQVVDDVLFVDGDVRFRSSVDGSGTVIASGDILFDNANPGHPVSLAGTTRLAFLSLHDISVGKGWPLRGILVAGRDVVFDKECNVEGIVIAGRDAWIHQDSHFIKLSLDRFPPSVSITSPLDGAFVNTPKLELSALSRANLGAVAEAFRGCRRLALR